MGFLDRLGKIATGLGGAIQSPFGLVKDLALGAFTDDDEFDGFVGTVYGSITKRGGQLFGNVLGPEEGLGAAIGGLPGAIRTPARTAINPVLEGLEYAGREAIREPLTAAVTAASLHQAGEGFDLGAGYKIAQNRSLGQSIALAVLTEDITDEAEVAEAMGTDWYESISGTFDAAARLFLEPDVVLFGGVTAARRAGVAAKSTQALAKVPGTAGLVEKGVFGRTIRTKKDVEAALAHPALGAINDKILDIRREAGIPDAGLPGEIEAFHGSPFKFEELGDPTTTRKVAGQPNAYMGTFFNTKEELAAGYAKAGPDEAGTVVKAGLTGKQKTFPSEPAFNEALWEHAIDQGIVTKDALLAPIRRQAKAAAAKGDDRGTEMLRGLEEGDEWRKLASRSAAQLPADVVREAGLAYRKSLMDEGYGLVEFGDGNYLALDPSNIRRAGKGEAPPPKDSAAVDRAAARIRDLAFHDHPDGAFVSRVLAEADDLPTAWGALMGHQPSIDTLLAKRADVAGQISRLSGDQAKIALAKRSMGTFDRPGQLPLELPDEIKAVERAQLDAEIDTLYDVEARLAHNEQANRMVREMPRISATSERRAAMVRSEFFQASPWAHPLRLAMNMQPRNMVDLNDATGDIQVARMLRKAKVALEVQDEIRGRYMAATDPTARHTVLEQAQSSAIRAIAERHGITDAKDIEAAINSAQGLQIQARDAILKSRAYDGKGRSKIVSVDEKTGVTHQINVPLAVSQEFNNFVVPNLDKVDEALADLADKSRRFNIPMASMLDGSVKGATEILDKFQGIWKPSVLFRVGWPIRVVGEEQLRIAATIGAMMTAGRSIRAAGRFGKDFAADSVTHAQQTLNHVPKSERALRSAEAASRRGLRLGTIRHRGVEFESAYGTDETFKSQYRALNSARQTMDSMVTNADVTKGKLRAEVLGEWVVLEPTNPAWGGAWENAVNSQIGNDTVWRQFLEGKSLDEVRGWIETTTEGRAYLRRLPHWKNQVDDWLEFMEQTVNDYLPTDELKALALQRKARADDIVAAIPDAAGRPNVNGAALADVSGKTKMAQWVGTNIRDRGMRWLGTIPTDVLSRNNYFDFLYTNEMKRQIDLILEQGGDLTADLIPQLEDKARNYGLRESKKLLYDLGEGSELAHTLRFIAPFYSAWQEVLTRWTGIAVENPAFVARMHEVWRSPERAGIVVDESGNRINADGTATSPLGDKVEAGKDRYINFRLLADENVIGKGLFNDLTRNVPGVKRVENAKFNKDGLNTILQGAPGFGPVVQIPVNEIAKGRPELEDSLRWALPFGASQSTMDMLLPATARRIKTKAGGEEDRLYSNQLMRIYWDMQVDYNLGKRTEAPTYGEAKKRTDSFYNVRTVASFISPVAPSFQSPYQPYIDAYRALKEKDPETADEKFLLQFGEEFFPLTQSLSKTMDGVPPTLEGAAARERYVDMIERNPELGGLIIGAEGAGEFSSAVYQSQLQKPVAPGSSDRQRQAFSFEEARAKPNERLGWSEYSKAMDIIDAERMNRGLPNLQVRAAQDLADLKRGVIAALEQKYPEWAEVFNVTDRGAWARKINGLREVAGDGRLAGRAEIAGLGQYLAARDQVLDILAARKAAGGASTITAASNTDLKGVWDQITGRMVTNPAFASVYYRYLERDPLELETRSA